MTSQTTLLTRIRAFLQQHDMTPSVFGKAALNDPGFVFDLERGRSPSLKTVDRVEAFMRGKSKFEQSRRAKV